MEETENYPLDEVSIKLFAEMRQAMQALENQWRGALALVLRQHDLQGHWVVAENGRALQKQTEVIQR